jgi:alpha-L-arabinofuranosidase
MHMKKQILSLCVGAALLAPHFATAQKTLQVAVNAPKGDIQPTMWGVFFEDINMGADGGIYAELVKNRSFEFFKPMMGWTVLGNKATEGDLLVVNRYAEKPSNPRFLRATVRNAAKGEMGLVNEGFKGMGFKKDLRYDFSVLYRQAAPGVKLHVELVDSTSKVIGSTVVALPKSGEAWEKATASLTATATVPKGRMNLWLEGSGRVDLDMISLFPTDTWKGRPGGMRADMIQMLADMKPGFLRFPGGCIVEGYDLSQRYQWKNTIGPVEDRQLIINRWNFEFAHRPAPDYFQTFGLGFFEYFQLAEDMGAEPMPILNAGMACQFNSAELVPLDELDPFVQDALDLIEFANGDTTTRWGRERAKMGHPAPFHLKMLGIGNENWGPQYIERLKVFTKAIKEKYPDMVLITSSGTDPDFKPFSPEGFNYLDTTLRTMKADVIDEHFYRTPDWFFANANRYDNYPRNGPKIFAGEYAAQSDKPVSIRNKNNMQTALAEAAFMTGMERNADVVNMASYAPLFAHSEGWQWTPDMIWVDNLRAFGTPNYYVQKLYSLNRGNKILPVTLDKENVAGQDSLYASAVLDTKTNEVIVKLVNASGKAQDVALNLQGAKKLAAQGKLTVLQASDLNMVNTLNDPMALAPKESTIAVKGKNVKLAAQPYSFSIVRIKM